MRRLVRCSNRPTLYCMPKATFDSRVILSFVFVCLRLKKDIFCYKNDTQSTNKTICCFSVLVIKSRSALVSVVEGRKQACRFHQPFYFVCRFAITSIEKPLSQITSMEHIFSAKALRQRQFPGCPTGCRPGYPSVISKLFP